MNECSEVSWALLDAYLIWVEANSRNPVDHQTARQFVLTQMPDESITVIDNVAHSLCERARRNEGTKVTRNACEKSKAA
jgi:hypothetical protein